MFTLSNLCVILSVATLFCTGVQTFYKLERWHYTLLNQIDFVVCIVFLFDFSERFLRCRNRWQFMKWGWIDLLCSIPAMGALRWEEYNKLLRCVRSIRSLKYIASWLLKDKRTGKLLDCTVITFMFVIVASITVFNCEKEAASGNIVNLGDSLWWAVTTITTTGYGDRYPTTDHGRMAAAAVMLLGSALSACLTAFIVSHFHNDDRVDHLVEENKLLHKKLDALLELAKKG